MTDTPLREYLTVVANLQAEAWKNNNPGKTDWKYKSQEEFYLDLGAPFSKEPLTKEEIEIVKEDIRGRIFRVKMCYANAASIALNGRLQYCEGYAIGRAPIPVHHAWVTINNKPVDVTWRDIAKPAKGVIDRIQNNIITCEYLGIVVPKKILTRHLLKTERYSPVVEGYQYDFGPLRTGSIGEE